MERVFTQEKEARKTKGDKEAVTMRKGERVKLLFSFSPTPKERVIRFTRAGETDQLEMPESDFFGATDEAE